MMRVVMPVAMMMVVMPLVAFVMVVMVMSPDRIINRMTDHRAPAEQ